MDRIILHIDFDSFFASCEQHFNPNLRNKPIGVTAENGRTCIIAASREAKRYGIKTGTRSWEAEKLYPEIIFVKADFDRYLEITKKFIEIASTFSPLVEVFSLDEVFIDATPIMHLHPSLLSLVSSFKKRIADEIGPTITVSVGASYNKLLAKLASGLNKPDGFFLINRENVDEVFRNVELTDMCGIGERFKRRLNMLGVQTLLELREYPLHLLRKEFGTVASQNLKRISLAQDDSPVISYMEDSVTKSVGRNYCLSHNEYDQDKILKILFELSEEIAIKLRRINKKGRTVGLYLAGETNMGGQKTFQTYTNLGEDIFKTCLSLRKKWDAEQGTNTPSEPGRKMVRQVGIWVSNLIDENAVTLSLFENPKKENVIKTIDAINEKFGHHTIRLGYLVDAPKLTTKPNGYFADKYQRSTLKNI